MSQSEDGEERPSREVAWRLFAAEFDDADYQFAESDEERAPNYVVTPTGARVNRLFAVGVLTSVEQVNEDVVRARVVDPTGAFVVYAGQYQPDALASLENADVPSFVAVTGKARTFSPDDSDAVYTSIRPESVNAVTPETRDRWVVSTAERTLSRIGTFADALDMAERGDDLTDALVERDAPYELASGISHAIDHYGTTPAYLAAVRELALDATRVVAGDLDEVEALALAPNEGDGTDADLSYPDAALAETEASEEGASMDERVEATPEGETVTQESEPSPDDFEAETETEATEIEAEATGPAEHEATAESGSASEDFAAARAEPSPDDESAGAVSDRSPDDFDGGETETETTADESEREATASASNTTESTSETAESGSASEGGDFAAARAEPSPDDESAGAVSDRSPDDFDGGETETEESAEDEQWEMDEETRAEVEEEFDVGFSSGEEIPEGGEADRSSDGDEASDDETGGADADLGGFESSADLDEADEADEADDLDAFTESEYDEPESEAEDAESAPPDVGLEDLVIDYMDDLDDGDGANRDELVRTVMEETDADEDAIEDAIQSALMSGRCYESGDDHLKAI
ncbi:hypothetical protein [Halarchaeum acidiphilum]|uniref:hypothetical protein n=1 Tax=Halarchaeum acidiphilum TaxID=489138 RepID=UPI001F2C3D23|nr:hypothetical protein [Halarchaeum acidiphilum]